MVESNWKSNAHTVSGASAAIVGTDDAPALEAGGVPVARIDVNTADAATLESLPSIGPAIAARMIAYREAHGPFGSIEELLRVRGVTRELLRRIEPFLAGFPSGAGTSPEEARE